MKKIEQTTPFGPLMMSPGDDRRAPNETNATTLAPANNARQSSVQKMNGEFYRVIGSTSAQKLLQKYRRHRLRLLRRKEFDRLRTMVPSIAARPKVSKVTVIEEAIKYIDHLHCALIARLQTKGLPQAFKGLGLQPKDFQHIDQSEIRELVRQAFPPSNEQTPPPTTPSSNIERSRSVASYLSRRPRWPPRHL